MSNAQTWTLAPRTIYSFVGLQSGSSSISLIVTSIDDVTARVDLTPKIAKELARELVERANMIEEML